MTFSRDSVLYPCRHRPIRRAAVPLPRKTCPCCFAFGADLLRERDDLDADAGRILGRDAGGGLRRRRDGVVPVRRDDVEHRH